MVHPAGAVPDGMEDTFQWTERMTVKLLEACRRCQLKHGSHVDFQWPEILEELRRGTNVAVDAVTAKNRINSMKRQWRLWKAFWHDETEFLCAPNSGSLLASADAWQRKIIKNIAFAKFRREGGPPARISNLWDAVYGGESNGDETGLCRRALPRTVYITPSVWPPRPRPSPTVTDISDDDDDPLSLSIGRSTPRSTSKKGKEKATSLDMMSPASVKKRRTGDGLYRNHLRNLQESSAPLFSGLRTSTELGASSGGTGQETEDRLKVCIGILDDMVEQNFITANDPLWAFTSCELSKWTAQTMMLELQTHEKRLAWLRFWFERRNFVQIPDV